ncbi:sigma-54 dependent transcriptional regulator [Desulfovibrio sp. OttesenSCG-928-A18]|nr:sigma-54 dependent transcriptional regulator [Desulfovibrio sp. OttesenSCG-928-A18]
MAGHILLVDDDDQLRSSFDNLLSAEGYRVRAAASGEAALALLDEELPDAVIMDVRMPGMDGLGALRLMRERDPRLPVIIMTAYSTTESAIEATKLGAFDYILKPFDIPAVLELLKKALEAGRMMRGKVLLHGAPEHDQGETEALVGVSAAMHELYKGIGRVAPTDALVLLRGESGTGKELVARALYQHSQRSTHPFTIVNCVAIPDTLLESELFGYERGAFTGADRRRIGKIEQAGGGTVFLDEIGDIPLSVQAKLLRLLQEKQIERLGGRETISVDVRIIAATNRNLEAAVSSGRFREDLYYRLNVVSLHLPPLRERKEDIPHLARHFMVRFAREMGGTVPPLGADALARLERHYWPGNVRELHNLLQNILIFNQGGTVSGADVERAFNVAVGGIDPGGVEYGPGGYGLAASGAFRSESGAAAFTPEQAAAGEALVRYVRARLCQPGPDKLFDALMDSMGEVIVREALALCSGNRSHTARMLGLSRPTLLARIDKYGL